MPATCRWTSASHRAIEVRYRSIDHLDGYVEALLKDGAPVDPKQPGFFGLAFIDHLDESKLPALVASTKAAGVWNVPTQSLIPAFMGAESTEALAARPEMRYLPKQLTDQWVTSRDNFLKGIASVTPEQRQRFDGRPRADHQSARRCGRRRPAGGRLAAGDAGAGMGDPRRAEGAGRLRA